MTDHLFPESTTYIHSYPAHEGFHARQPYHAPESRPYVYEDPVKRPNQISAVGYEGQAKDPSPGTSRCGEREPKPKPPKPVCSSLGHVELTELGEADRTFFLAKTYRTTYHDYAKEEPSASVGGLATKKPFCRQDDAMLHVLNATKPNLAYYGFGLPNRCCVAWSNVQSRTLPNENRTYVSEKKRLENPYTGYPEKMYPFILSKELCPHYDGSFVFGYTGHQRRCLDYPADVSGILRRDFPKHVPRALTTNQAKLAYLPIPMCRDINKPVDETGIRNDVMSSQRSVNAINAQP